MRFPVVSASAFLLATESFGQQTADPAQAPTALGTAFFKALLDEDGNTVDGDLLVQGARNRLVSAIS